MEELRALPKAYAALIVGKVLIGIICIISLVFLCVGLVAFYLHTKNYSLSVIIGGAFSTWLVIILMLMAFVFYKRKEVKQRKDELLQTAHKELIAVIALHSLNAALRKFRHAKTP
jgi:hypothetical protein